MEKVREENSAGDAKCRRKDCDHPLKIEGHNMLGSSPVVFDSGGSTWLECPPNVYVESLKNRFNRGVTSLVGSEPPCSSNCPEENDTRLRVEELTTRNCRIPDMTMVRSSDGRGKMHPKKGQWKHLYQLAGGSKSNSQHGGSASRDKDQMMFCVREDLKRMPSDQKVLSSKQTKQNPEVYAHLTNGYNKVISSNTLRLADTRSKELPTSCFFPQFSVKKTLKGKGVASSNQEAQDGSGVAVMCHKDETPANINGVTSDAVFNSSANSNHPESPHDGINLRDRLKPGCRRLNKVESLHLFKKIVELVGFAHCHGVSLQDIRPSCFILLPSNRVKYTGPFPQMEIQDVMYHKKNKKRPLEKDEDAYENMKQQQKSSENPKSLGHQFQLTSKCGFGNKYTDETSIDASDLRHLSNTEQKAKKKSRYRNAVVAAQQQSNSVNVQLEKKWYASPEDLNERACTFAANIYSLGVLLFELLCCSESWERHSTVMLDLQRRIFPPNILLGHPIEAGFCLWLLHPDPSSRPTTREILQSELLCGSQELNAGEDLLPSAEVEDADSDMLLYFLTMMKEQKQNHASKLAKDLGCLEADIKDVMRRNSLRTSLDSSCTHKDFTNGREQGFQLDDSVSSGVICKPISESKKNEAKLIRSISQLENAYFSMRSETQHADDNAKVRSDKDLLKNREKLSPVENENAKPCINQEPADRLGSFFESVCKFACYSKLEVCGTLRNGDLLNSSNVICSLSVDRDDEYIAAAGVSKKIKIFQCSALLNDAIDIHYPVVEMPNKSKLSCVCWNNYIKNYLASTDYDGVVQMWDASTGQGFCQYSEHQKRAWSVDFSQADPTKFASGSDDCSVKLWNINEKNSTSSIWNPANVCCVQFSAYSSHLLVFGSADYKIYGYDLRHTRIPWCTLAGHGKAVSYVRFVDSETLVSASTDNTLKLWDLNKTSPVGLSFGACSLTFSGHTNEKNFVGLSALDGYIACGSESNEVFAYYKSLPMPITSYKFGSVDPISGHEIADDNAQFVSSVCGRRKSNMIVAANSTGNIKLLQMV